MTQIKKVKLCVTVLQRRVEQFLQRVHLEMGIPLHKSCVTFTHKSGIIPLRR